MSDLAAPDPGFVPMSEEQLAQLQSDITGLLEQLDAVREESANKDELIRKLIERNQELVDVVREKNRRIMQLGGAPDE